MPHPDAFNEPRVVIRTNQAGATHYGDLHHAVTFANCLKEAADEYHYNTIIRFRDEHADVQYRAVEIAFDSGELVVSLVPTA